MIALVSLLVQKNLQLAAMKLCASESMRESAGVDERRGDGAKQASGGVMGVSIQVHSCALCFA